MYTPDLDRVQSKITEMNTILESLRGRLVQKITGRDLYNYESGIQVDQEEIW